MSGYEAAAPSWDRSGRAYLGVADALADAVDRLFESLVEAGQCFGTDGFVGRPAFNGGEKSVGFRAARDDLLARVVLVVNLVRVAGHGQIVTGVNYQDAEQASTAVVTKDLQRAQQTLAAVARDDVYELKALPDNLITPVPAPGPVLTALGLLEMFGLQCEWANGHPDKVAGIGPALRDLSVALEQARIQLGQQTTTVIGANRGQARDAYVTAVNSLCVHGGVLSRLSDEAHDLADNCGTVASTIKAAQLQFLYSALFIIALTPLTSFGPLGALLARVEIAAAGRVLSMFLLSCTKAVLVFVALDAAHQEAWRQEHLQHGWKVGETLLSAAEAVTMTVVTGGLHAGFTRLAGRHSPFATISAAMNATGLAGRAARSGFTATTVTAATMATQAAFDKGHVDPVQAVEAGVAMAGIGAFAKNPHPSTTLLPPDFKGTPGPRGTLDPHGPAPGQGRPAPRMSTDDVVNPQDRDFDTNDRGVGDDLRGETVAPGIDTISGTASAGGGSTTTAAYHDPGTAGTGHEASPPMDGALGGQRRIGDILDGSSGHTTIDSVQGPGVYSPGVHGSPRETPTRRWTPAASADRMTHGPLRPDPGRPPSNPLRVKPSTADPLPGRPAQRDDGTSVVRDQSTPVRTAADHQGVSPTQRPLTTSPEGLGPSDTSNSPRPPAEDPAQRPATDAFMPPEKGAAGQPGVTVGVPVDDGAATGLEPIPDPLPVDPHERIASDPEGIHRDLGSDDHRRRADALAQVHAAAVVGNEASAHSAVPSTHIGDIRSDATAAPEAFADRVRDGIASGRPEMHYLSGGSHAEFSKLLRFPDGTDVVHQRFSDPSDADRVEAAAIVARAIDANVPTVHRIDANEIYQEFIAARSADEAYPGHGFDSAELYHTGEQYTPSGRRLGILDLLIDNRDRHNLNWYPDHHGEVLGIDHSRAFGRRWDDIEGEDPGYRNDLFTRQFAERDATGDPVWRPNDLSPEDIDFLRRQLRALAPEFDRLGHPEWHAKMMSVLDELAAHRTGDTPLLAETHNVSHDQPKAGEIFARSDRAAEDAPDSAFDGQRVRVPDELMSDRSLPGRSIRDAADPRGEALGLSARPYKAEAPGAEPLNESWQPDSPGQMITMPAPAEVRLSFGGAQKYHLARGEEIMVGRSSASPVSEELYRFGDVSRRHATFGVDLDGNPWIRDEGSRNGTRIEDRLISPGEKVPLKDGDELRLGAHFKQRVHIFDPAVSPQRGHELSNAGEGLPRIVDSPDLPRDRRRADRYGTPLTRWDGTRMPLFDGDPTREQIQQGRLGDCGIIATLGAVASHRPEVIRDCIRQTPDGNYEVRLHEAQERSDHMGYDPTGRSVVLTVTPELPVRGDEPYIPAFARGSAAAWGPIMEKALAGIDRTWNDEQRQEWAGRQSGPGEHGEAPWGYARINEGVHFSLNPVAELLTQLTGEPSAVPRFFHKSDPELYAEFQNRLSERNPILVTPTSSHGTELPHKIIAFHTYEVIRVDPSEDLIYLHNPWNLRHPEPMSMDAFIRYFVRFYAMLE